MTAVDSLCFEFPLEGLHMKKILSAIVFISVIIMNTPAHATWHYYYKWVILMWQDDGTEKGRLKIGTTETATDGYDPLYEVDAFFAGSLRSYFYHPEWGRASSLEGASDHFWADIRSTTLPQTWDFSVEAYRTDRNVKVYWDLSYMHPEICTNVELTMADMENGETIVLTENPTASYSYYNASSSPHTFRVNAKEIPVVKDTPTNLGANPGGGQVVLHWNTVPAMAGYRVYRGENGGSRALISGDSLITDTNGDGIVSFVDKNLQKGKTPITYSYAVTAVNASGCESEQTATVEVTR